MKVLLLSIYKPKKGGIVTHVENLIRFSKNDFEIITYNKFINVPVFRALSFVIGGFARGMGKDFDVLHAHYIFPQGFLGVLLKKVKKKPLILTVHGSDVNIFAKTRLGWAISRYIIRNSDIVVAVSKYLKDELISLGGDEKKIRVVYGGVESRQAPAVLRHRGRTLLYVGSLIRQKGLDILIDAVRILSRDEKELELIVVGDGPERQKLEKIKKTHGLDNIRFEGFQENLEPYFQKADVFILPSRQEGFGLVLLEAMSHGLPVIASGVGGIPEIVENNKNGFLFNRDNPEDLAEKIKYLLDSGNYGELSQFAIATAKRFSWSEFGRKMDDVYEEKSNRGIK